MKFVSQIDLHANISVKKKSHAWLRVKWKQAKKKFYCIVSISYFHLFLFPIIEVFFLM